MAFSKEQFDKMIDMYSKEINYADSAFEMFFMMKYGDKGWEDAYEVAPAFFSISRKAIFQEVLLTIAKLYKSSNGSERNFTKFLNLIESNPKIYGLEHKGELLREVSRFRTEIENREDSIEKIARWRNKLLAHYDTEYFLEPSKIGDDSSLSAEEIRDLIQNGRELINSLSRLTTGIIPSGRYYNYDDIKNLIGLVLKYK